MRGERGWIVLYTEHLDSARIAFEDALNGLFVVEGRFKKARPLLTRAFDSLRKTYAPTSPKVQGATRLIVELRVSWQTLERTMRYLYDG